ncbi:LPXTG cell wall anchor domain-containing protein [Candidatus Enterococcus murrayae]|uniref:LPXTG cell wall anchor domain-containing protein n=1 Tax=Candidatus Enterococcus murrayae TaxID=2815321 RepID=A0ABS3HGI8_9ENTE|nr:LPXTG cell wall anchor domain-containing protein [Enterococcus sp. MJM16]
MKKKIGLYIATAFFCLSAGCASVLAASHDGQSPIGVGFYDPTSSSSTSSSTTPSTTSSTSSTTSDSSSSTDSNSSTVDSSSKDRIVPITNNRGGSSGGGYWDYITDTASKVLPKTGEFIGNHLALIGMGMLVIVFFYLRKNRRKKV